MANRMKDFLPVMEQERIQAFHEIERKFQLDELTLDEARRQLRERVGVLRPYHYAYMEQTLREEETDECFREDIGKLHLLLEGLMDFSRPQLPEDHPLARYYQENDAMRRLLQSVEDLVQYPVIRNQWEELYEQLCRYPLHYTRKQNQLYPLLERKGFDRPTTTMWTFDDLVRDELRDSQRLLAEGLEEEFIRKQEELLGHCRDLMEKEETILYPTALALISEAEFEDMKTGDREIGFALIEVDEPQARPSEHPVSPSDAFARDLQALLAKHGYGSAAQDEEMDVATGRLTLEQINLIYRHLPVDLSYVDEQELVKFYSDTEHRVFPRSKNVIGRQVINCHPRKSFHAVREIIDKFRAGEQDKAEFWINKPGLFIYITYVAVRDAEGRFRGVLEMMQDCTRIRSLQGSQTLLSWNDSPTGEQPRQEETSVADGPDMEEDALEETEAVPLAADKITADTRLKALFKQYPSLRKNLAQAVPAFKMLDSPLGKLMLQRATVGMAAERSGLGLERMLRLIRQCME